MARRTSLQALAALSVAALSSGACSRNTPADNGIGVQSIVFVKRATTSPDGTVDVAGGNGQVLDYQRYVPGGSLNLLSPARADGTLTNLTSDFPTADFNGADVSFDASQAVFSMKRDDSDHYHIYTVQLAPGADGRFEMHQKTAGDQDDINPIYIPGGRIAFVTNQMYTPMGTRADEYEHAREALQLATISVDGGDADRHLFAQNLSHVVAPWLRYDGRIGFSQWEHFGPVNDVKLRVANPDGTQILAIAGQHSKPANSLFTVKELSPNVMIAVGTSRNRTIHAGALVTIDVRNQSDPTCLDNSAYASGGVLGHACLDEESSTACQKDSDCPGTSDCDQIRHVCQQFKVLTPDVPTDNRPSPVGRYREPSVLPDGRLLVSWADGPVNDLNEQSITPPDFGIYVYDPASGKNQLVYDDRGTWDVNALPVVARAEPPVIGDTQHVQDATQPTRIGSIDVSQTSLNETIGGADHPPLDGMSLRDALKNGAVAVRVIEGFSSEAAKGVTMFGLTMFEGAAVLGEAPVYSDGSWLANVPSYLPLHLQPIDKYGLAIRNQRLWIQGMPGEERRCVGCHESRTGQGVPRLAQQTVAEIHGPAQYTEAIADRAEYPWDKRVQPILDAKCASCHNSSTTDYYYLTRTDPVSGAKTTYKIPTLDLSSTPVTAYYDRKVMTWPASYVSIFYPASIEMTKNTTLTGTVPCTGTQGLKAETASGKKCTPLWGIPGDARGSALTEKINLRASDGSTAWPGALHPEDKGINLTDDERKTIAVYPMDLGGQYYARQNTGFVPFTGGDPVTKHPRSEP